MPSSGSVSLDVVIFGGGAAGLWLLDDLVREGYRVLVLEAFELGAGQTVASQGIIHGGLKYTLQGLFTPSAKSIRDMPHRWRRCLAGERTPDLTGTRRRAEFCHLWQTTGLSSRAAMIGARTGLRVGPKRLDPEARPRVLRDCPGVVARLDEQVIEPESFVADLANRNHGHILKIDLESGLELDAIGPGRVEVVRLINPASGAPLDLAPRFVVLTAGAGNGDMRRRAGLDAERMQRRPLHMAVARGALPELNGHCVDGMHTRATITTTRDYADRTIWQVGGQVAEDGVSMDRAALIRHAHRELTAILPGLDLTSIEWTTYRVDRAEGLARGGRRPGAARVFRDGNTITAWPTKIALVPRLALDVRGRLPPPEGPPEFEPGVLDGWPRPTVAAPPWEEDLPWFPVS